MMHEYLADTNNSPNNLEQLKQFVHVLQIMTAWEMHADLSSAIYTFTENDKIYTSKASKFNQVINGKPRVFFKLRNSHRKL